MDQSGSLDDPTRAFDDLRREVSLGLRAIQGLAAERNDQPDYSDTLKEMDKRLAKNAEMLTAIANSPAMQFTPASFAQATARASVDARDRDTDMLRAAASTLDDHTRQLRLAIDQVRVSSEQKTEVRWALVVGLAIGIALWSILPGAFMRSLPSDWHAPEWMALRTMRADNTQGARRLLEATSQSRQPAQAQVPPNKITPDTSNASMSVKPPTRRSRNKTPGDQHRGI